MSNRVESRVSGSQGALEDLDRVQSHDEDLNGRICLSLHLFFGPPPIKQKKYLFLLPNVMDDLSQQSILAKLKINE